MTFWTTQILLHHLNYLPNLSKQRQAAMKLYLNLIWSDILVISWLGSVRSPFWQGNGKEIVLTLDRMILISRCIQLTSDPFLSSLFHTSLWIVSRWTPRITMLVFRKQNFWILYGETFYFFRSKEDFEQWLLDPNLTKVERRALVKSFFVFKKNSLRLYTLRQKRTRLYPLGGNM